MSTDFPLVSVIMPVRNGLPWIRQAVHSVAEQSWPAIEVLVIDDRSSDGTVDAINSGLKNVAVLKNSGQGACAARNTGVQASSGSYLQFLDSDDFLSAEKIEFQMQRLLNCSSPDRSVCYSRLVQFRKDENPQSGEQWHETERSFSRPLALLSEMLRTGRFVQTGQWLTPRRLVNAAGSWDESLNADQDGDFFARVLAAANECIACPAATTYYRRLPAGQQISGSKSPKHFESRFKALQRKIDILGDFVNADELREIIGKQCIPLAMSSFPYNKSVARHCLKLIKANGLSFTPQFPTRQLQLIASIFGWRAARYCSYIKHRGHG
jgi:glycosyltransferase involved in cell wall biosynthesis